VDGSARAGVLPLRPLTVGELLDAAVALLRTRALPLLGAGLLLAAAEQAVLYPLRSAAFITTFYVPDDDHVAQWWFIVALGFGIEAMIIAVLGGLASAAAVPALVGRARATAAGRVARRAGPVAVVAIVVGVLAGASSSLLLLPWFAVYPLFGLAVPAVVIDRLGPARALGRSVGLVFRSMLRPGMIRLLGYFGWLLFRLALGIGGVAVIGLLPGMESVGTNALLPSIAWMLVNAVAYPTLACLDAVLHLEARMRVEGLDLTLGRTLRRGGDVERALVVAR
jgi:hypothetical protein